MTTTTTPTRPTKKKSAPAKKKTGAAPSTASSETHWRDSPGVKKETSSPETPKTGENGPADEPKRTAKQSGGMSTGKKIAAAAGVAAAAVAGVAAVKGMKGSKKRTVFVVERGEDGWELHRENGNGTPRTFDSKQKALEAARKEAKSHQPSELVVHRADGTVQDRFSLGD